MHWAKLKKMKYDAWLAQMSGEVPRHPEDTYADLLHNDKASLLPDMPRPKKPPGVPTDG